MGPTAPTPAFAIGAKTDDPILMYLNDIYTIGANLAGLPAVSVPCGLVGGLPVGLQIIGPHFAEERLLAAAHAWQRATDWHRRLPPASRERRRWNGKPSSASRSTRSSRRARRSSPARRPPTARRRTAGEPGGPRLPGRAAGAEPRGRAHGGQVRARGRRPGGARARSSRARITSTPTCRRATRSASTSCRSSSTATVEIVLEDGARKVDRRHARPPRGGRRQVAARGARPRERHRPQPRGHAAARDRVGARHALGPRGRRVHEEDPHAGALPRDLRRQHAGGLVPLRRQRLRAPRTARASTGPAARSRTSIPSASWSARSTTRSSARSS